MTRESKPTLTPHLPFGLTLPALGGHQTQISYSEISLTCGQNGPWKYLGQHRDIWLVCTSILEKCHKCLCDWESVLLRTPWLRVIILFQTLWFTACCIFCLDQVSFTTIQGVDCTGSHASAENCDLPQLPHKYTNTQIHKYTQWQLHNDTNASIRL